MYYELYLEVKATATKRIVLHFILAFSWQVLVINIFDKLFFLTLCHTPRFDITPGVFVSC